MPDHDPPPLPPVPEVPPVYWLGVCHGLDAASALMEASPEEIDDILRRFPILSLPEFPDAIAGFPEASNHPELAEVFNADAGALRALMNLLRTEAAESLARLLIACAIELAQEVRGIPRLNVSRAIELFTTARSLLPPMDPVFAHCLLNEGGARQELAELGVDPRGNLEEGVRLYARARDGLDPSSPAFAPSLTNEARARVDLAGLGVDPRGNLTRLRLRPTRCK
jgi:hypothetical protein